MDLSESNGLQKRNGDQLDPQLMPQYGAPIGMVPGSASGTTSPFPLWPGMPNLASPMAEPFNSTLLNQSSGKFPFSGMIPPTGLPNFPSEPGFIERAARLSCFGTNGGFTSLMNSPILNQTQKGELNSLSIGAGSSHGNMDNNTEIPNDERNSMDENQNTTADSSHDTGGKKRKRPNQDQSMENAQGNNEDEIIKQNNGDGKKDAENNHGKSNGRNNNNNSSNNKDGSDASKDYIHVRARRGQATNSHSLAERVRREKISERMKYLQELVPGCSKVTGKAVMLDEIINYVQSLQRQVEFLSMKLAAVNPRLDLNIEALLSKDMLQGRVGCSSAVGFTPEMFHAQLSQPGLLPPGFQIPDFRRSITPQLSSINPFKDPHPSQMANPWQDELHNVMSMNFNTNPPMSTQEVNAKPGDGFQI